MSNFLSRIATSIAQRRGQPCISVIDVLELLAGGTTEAGILSGYPCLEPDDIRASLAYATEETHFRPAVMPMSVS
jgi:uncharacterized protein (DUF433 family)